MWERSGNASGTSPPLIHTMYFIVCRPHDPDSTALSRVMRHEGIRPRAMAHDPKVGPFHVRTISSHTIGRATSETHPPDTRQRMCLLAINTSDRIPQSPLTALGHKRKRLSPAADFDPTSPNPSGTVSRASWL